MLSRLLKRNEGQECIPQLLACLNTTPGSINPTVSKVHFLAVAYVDTHYESAPDRPSSASWVRKGVGLGTRAHGCLWVRCVCESIRM